MFLTYRLDIFGKDTDFSVYRMLSNNFLTVRRSIASNVPAVCDVRSEAEHVAKPPKRSAGRIQFCYMTCRRTLLS
jgi:hypothetical protein